MNEGWVGKEEWLRKEAYSCLKDLGIEMEYDDFLIWLKLKLGEQNASAKK